MESRCTNCCTGCVRRNIKRCQLNERWSATKREACRLMPLVCIVNVGSLNMLLLPGGTGKNSDSPSPSRGVTLIRRVGAWEGDDGWGRITRMEGERLGERQTGRGWEGKRKINCQKKHKGKDERCLQGSSVFLITMQHYRSDTVIKMSLTATLQAVYRYSNTTRKSGRNLEDKVRDSDRWRQNI